MIHYHGTPITPESCALRVLPGRHAFVPWSDYRNAELVAAVCQSFALDNGAFSAWTKGEPITDWAPFYEWSGHWLTHPACDWAVIPDVIGGTEAENDALVDEWPHGPWNGVPVWHLNESIDRLVRLAKDWPRVALGSCAEFDVKKPKACIARLYDAIDPISVDGRPKVKLHGLRMLNPYIVTRVPLASADSTNVAINLGRDVNWKGTYLPATKETRAQVLAERIEQHQSPDSIPPMAMSLFDELTIDDEEALSA